MIIKNISGSNVIHAYQASYAYPKPDPSCRPVVISIEFPERYYTLIILIAWMQIISLNQSKYTEAATLKKSFNIISLTSRLEF